MAKQINTNKKTELSKKEELDKMLKYIKKRLMINLISVFPLFFGSFLFYITFMVFLETEKLTKNMYISFFISIGLFIIYFIIFLIKRGIFRQQKTIYPSNLFQKLVKLAIYRLDSKKDFEIVLSKIIYFLDGYKSKITSTVNIVGFPCEIGIREEEEDLIDKLEEIFAKIKSYPVNEQKNLLNKMINLNLDEISKKQINQIYLELESIKIKQKTFFELMKDTLSIKGVRISLKILGLVLGLFTLSLLIWFIPIWINIDVPSQSKYTIIWMVVGTIIGISFVKARELTK